MQITKVFKPFLQRHPDKKYWDIECLKFDLSLISKGDILTAISPRNYGKTYSVIEFCKELLEKGESVAYGRYNQPELGSSIGDWLNKCPELVPVTVKESKLTWFEYPKTGAKLCFFSWSIAQNVKGTDHPFSFIICDEFIPERYTNKSRFDTEFADWTSVYKTLARSYNPTVIMLANCIQWINPFFLAWGISPVNKGCAVRFTDYFSINIDGEKFKTSRTVLVENVGATKPIIERNLKQQAISFSSDADMYAYFQNEMHQEYTQIGVCPDLSVPLLNIQIMSENYFMRARIHEGRMYWVKVKHDPTQRCATSEPEFIDFNLGIVKNKSINVGLEQVFNEGLCVFDTTVTLMAFMRFLRHNRGFTQLG